MFAGLMLLVLLAMRLFPETPAARSLHKYLVELPVVWWGGLDRRQLLYAVVLTLIMFSFWEAVAVFGSMDLIFVYAFDVALYLDAVIAAVTLAATTNIKAVRSGLRGRLARLKIPRGPARRFTLRARHPRSTRNKLPTNDDEPASRLLAA